MSEAAFTLQAGLRAALPAAIFSGVPSTIYALLSQRDPLEAALAAGSIVLPHEQRRLRLLLAAVPVHLALSIGWAVVLVKTLPRRNLIREGALAGLAIAAIDLGVIGRPYPRIRALPLLPQIADHVAFGVIASVALSRHEEAMTA